MFLGALVQDLDILDVAGILQTATTKVNVLRSLLQDQRLHTHPPKNLDCSIIAHQQD
jgi:hypothetical protein